MPRSFFVLLFCLSAGVLAAQQAPYNAPTPKGLAPAVSLARDPGKLAEAIRGSYYHPDGLTGMNCEVSVDWPAFFSSAKATVPPERMKMIQGLKVYAQAARGKVPELTFDWTSGRLDTNQQLEDGLKQMIGGFYQFYWPLVASPMARSATEFKKIEPLADGSSRIYESDKNMDVVLTADKDGVPTHSSFSGMGESGNVDITYAASPKPASGDLRRIAGATVSEQIGSSSFNVAFTLDYQSVSGFYIPQNIKFDLLGAYSIKMALSNCSITAEQQNVRQIPAR